MSKTIKLVPRVNKSNNQISFNLKKRLLPKTFRDKLPKLKEIKLELEDFEWD